MFPEYEQPVTTLIADLFGFGFLCLVIYLKYLWDDRR